MIFSQGGIRAIAASAIVALLLQASSCDRPSAEKGGTGEVLARIDSEVITVAEFREALAGASRQYPRIYSGEGKREKLLNHLVDEEMLFAEALREGYDKDPTIAGEFRRRVVGEYLKKNLVPLLDGVKVSEEDVSRHYRENLERYRARELVRAAVISFKISPSAADVDRNTLLGKARAALAEARGLSSEIAGFGELAARYSDDSRTKGLGGDIGWIIKAPGGGGLDPVLHAAILQLQKPGDLSPVIETDTAIYLAKLMAIRPARQRPLSEVRSAARTILLKQAKAEIQEEFYRKLRSGRKITLHLDALDPEKLEESSGGAGKPVASD